MRIKMLTRSEQKTLELIQSFIQQHRYSPTVEEIAAGLGIKSKGVAYRYVKALAQNGFIQLTPKKQRNISLVAKDNPNTIPLVGKIAAGKPIEAISGTDELDLNDLFTTRKSRYALQVKGDSMIDEGIHDGDLVICEQTQEAKNGEIVVALIDNHDATLKKIQFNKDHSITLIPANANMKPMHYSAEQVRIQGKFIGLLRVSK